MQYTSKFVLRASERVSNYPWHTKLELRFSSANGAGLITADVMFIYIFTKNELGLTHRDN